MKKTIALLLAALITLTVLASCKNYEDQAYLNNLLDGTGFSGVVLVTKNGHTICEAAQGVENNNSNQNITTDTRFCIGSVSKQFAATAILLLQQDGKLSVDDNLSKYFPSYKYGNDLKIRHLLEMRSGIKEFYDVEYIDDAFTELPTEDLRGVITNDNTVEQNQKLLEDWLLRQPLEFEPDTEFEYSNSNYFLLARIVEIVSEKSYNDFVRERIFDFVDYTLPLYKGEGKSMLLIAIGCTGGKHRSVALTQALYDHLSENKNKVAVQHRDIDKV